MNIEQEKQKLQAEYNSICARYGDAQLKVKYWSEQAAMCERQINELNQKDQELREQQKQADASTEDQNSAA